MGDKNDHDDDSVNTPQDQKSESMFGNDVNKKSGKPTKGYRWMCFTFLMIAILSIIVIWHDDFEIYKK